MAFEHSLSVALDGFTLHAATRAGGLDGQGREALLNTRHSGGLSISSKTESACVAGPTRHFASTTSERRTRLFIVRVYHQRRERIAR
jgi:hypothetical protein